MEVIIDHFIGQLKELLNTEAVLYEEDEEREYIEISSYISQSPVKSQVQTKSQVSIQGPFRISKDFSNKPVDDENLFYCLEHIKKSLNTKDKIQEEIYDLDLKRLSMRKKKELKPKVGSVQEESKSPFGG